jgi:hypothetical protein
MEKLPAPKLFSEFVYLIAVVFATQTQAVDSGVPAPVPRAGKPGPPMLLGTSVGSDQNNQLVKSLGFSHAQTDSDHLTVNEPEPGRWDWTSADAGLAAVQKAGMKWQYFPHFQWPPEWYRKSEKFIPSIGLRSKRRLAAMSLWSPDIVPWFERGYAALAQHYGRGNDKLYAIYLGIHGDFGETIFPMGWHPDEKNRFGENGTGLPDFWCGDDHARDDFRRFVRSKYHTLQKLNAAWGTQLKDFSRVEYPPAASDAAVGIPGTPEGRRHWLDFIQWYCDSMTKFTGEVCRIARQYFPKTLLELPVGGGSENVMYGQDTTALPKIARQYDVHIRSTHGGYASFPQGYTAMIKRIATPCKVYGVPHWLEPPGAITPEGEVSRIMEALSCGNVGFWDWGQNPVGAANAFREYANYLTQERPLVDVALFFPTTDHRLRPGNNFPPRLEAVGRELRDVMDFDIVDEELIADDALKLYRVLVWVEGKYVEEKTLKTLAAWIKKGGVLVWWGADVPETVEGRTDLSSALLGLTQPSPWQNGGPLEIRQPRFLRHLEAHASKRADATVGETHKSAVVLATAGSRPAIWAMPHRRGWVIAAAALDQPTFNELVRDAAYNLSRLDPTKADALEVDTDWDGVYATLLAGDEVILHNLNPEARSKNVGGTQVVLPPKSLRSVLIMRANPAGN